MKKPSKYDRLSQDFPRLYRLEGRETCFTDWGVECGAGWFDLIYKLSADIEAAAREAGLDPNSDAWPRVAQVKEKFGTLRFYLDVAAPWDPSEFAVEGNPDAGMFALRPVAKAPRIRELIREAEARSADICEGCGAPGKLRKNYWIHTYCDLCEARYKRGQKTGI